LLQIGVLLIPPFRVGLCAIALKQSGYSEKETSQAPDRRCGECKHHGYRKASQIIVGPCRVDETKKESHGEKVSQNYERPPVGLSDFRSTFIPKHKTSSVLVIETHGKFDVDTR
jgi:hypothetical protein